jgi:hypothetical protein
VSPAHHRFFRERTNISNGRQSFSYSKAKWAVYVALFKGKYKLINTYPSEFALSGSSDYPYAFLGEQNYRR